MFDCYVLKLLSNTYNHISGIPNMCLPDSRHRVLFEILITVNVACYFYFHLIVALTRPMPRMPMPSYTWKPC